MELKFGYKSIDLKKLRIFCEREGEMVCYQKGEQMEHENIPSQWFGFVAKGCFKYMTRGLSDGRQHITWFSFEGEFAGDYPSCLDSRPSQTTIEAMLPTCLFRVSGEQLMLFYKQNEYTMELRSLVSEQLLCQARARYLDFHRAMPRKRYELLLHRCPGIVEHLPLHAIASFLNITPKTLSMIRREITFGQ